MKSLLIFLFLLLSSLCLVRSQEEELRKAEYFLDVDIDSVLFYADKAAAISLELDKGQFFLDAQAYIIEAAFYREDLELASQSLNAQKEWLEHNAERIEESDEWIPYKLGYWFDRGRYNYREYNYEAALKDFFQIRKAMDSVPENLISEYSLSWFLTSSYDYIGTIYRNQYKWGLAREFFSENRKLHIKFDHGEEALLDTGNLLASLLSAEQSFDESNQLIRKSISYYLSRSPEGYINSLRSTGLLLVNNLTKQKEWSQAEKDWNALRPYFKPGERYFTDFRILEGKIAMGQLRSQRAIAVLSAITKEVDMEDDPGNWALAHMLLARVYEEDNKIDKAGDVYNQVLLPLTRARDPLEIIPVDELSLIEAACQYHLRRGDNEGLKRILELTRYTWERMQALRWQFHTDLDKQNLTEAALPILETGITSCKRLMRREASEAYIDTAFTFIEWSKSPILLDAQLRNNAMVFGDLPDSLRLKERKLKREATKNRSGSQRIKWEQEYSEFVQDLRNHHPNYFALKYANPEPHLEEARKALGNDEIMLNYFFGDREVFLLCQTDKDKQLFEFPVGDEDNGLFRQYLDKVSQPTSNLDSLAKLSNLIYAKYVEPALAFSNKSNLIILPDGLLRSIPFEALNQNALNPNSFLIQKHSVRYLLSFRSQQQLKQPHGRGRMLAMAPKFDESASADSNQNLPPLANNLKEAEEVTRILNGHLLPQAESEKAKILELIQDFSVLHLATHAITDDQTPENSYLALGSEGSDNALFVNEIYAMNVSTQLVTLSACNTGGGKLNRGEGALSLARAFFYSGTQSLVTSLWNVNDATAVELMTDFYQNLSEGNSKSLSLAKSKRSFLDRWKGSALVHPYYWSSFRLQGSDRPLLIGSKGQTSGWWIFASVAVFGFLIFVFRKRLSQLF